MNVTSVRVELDQHAEVVRRVSHEMAGQIEALANATVPAGVGTTFFDSTTPMGAVAQLFACRNLACVSQQRDNGEAPLCVD